ncbi:sulfate/thiosulfate transport system ATP-binding protein [Candidatus Hakubella thermalkaliphila]|uniref:Sulfate/thiosulfate transport system ATP-binding protein n=3 Tax=Candidatus Hakubella thermalkaliphila TaxID=2754717 RepID=A0A6V8PQT8_9ACTN|nr:ABC transporter ATP-binding protein [Candidatus Hakubella thermalkaliphila]GFP27775.1 sulfate/thiosulfate transport system ATP-binding protein [Candidatus Hakubella thermalkaliphila]GFP35032.1 sulfate/thiosulfate transport system ATP-binding protein [Candidatus Hakubella thermalkaliphila]GFP43643.1 sulfate/thiosulfate transport system ATP-binding protein [Candidatus Hakubella thermalkaliphila]
MGQSAIPVEVVDLEQEYDGRRVLSVPALTVKQGEVFVLIGPNGSGKSTFLRIINLLEKPSRGKVFLFGFEPRTRSEILQARRKMSMVFQEPLLFSASVYNNIAYGLRIRREKEGRIRQKVEDLMEKLEISHLAKRLATGLSGGEAQRVSLARALAVEPEIFLLDEPLASLDAPTRESLRSDLGGLLRELGITSIYVTHDRTEAIILADRIAVMNEGQILQEGTADEVFNKPRDELVASFVGVETILRGIVVSRMEQLAEIEIWGKRIEAVSSCQVGDEVLVFLRPEDITVTLPGDGGVRSSARNIFPGRIEKITHLGYLVKLHLDCGFSLRALITRVSATELGLTEGMGIMASFKATAVHVVRRG